MHQAILGACAIVISPAGYLLTKCLGALAQTAAGSLF
jgi:hypothetical protein